MGKSAKLSQVPNAIAFSARKTSAQTFSTAAFTKVLFNVEDFDTGTFYDSATGRFTPNVEGYYQVNACVINGSNSGIAMTSIFKNGVEHKRGLQVTQSSPSLLFASGVSALVYCNGTTDYLEIDVYFSAAGVTADTGGLTYFDACLVRAV